jgi:hypothetical protein
MVMLLSDVTIDQTNQRQVAIDRTASGSPLPLGKDSWASLEPDPNFRPIQSSRNDLVQAKTSDMTTTLKQHIAQQPSANWWSALVYRFNSVPEPKSPLTGASAALSAPAFLPDCRSFAVEYAGDFVTQLQDVRGVGSAVPDGKVTIEDMLDPMYGQVTSATPDGVIDFYTVPTGATGTLGAERIERVRFYGLPRDADQTGIVRGNATRTIDLGAVVPLRDMVRSGVSMNTSLASYIAPFERSITFAPSNNYMAPLAFRPNDNYVCVWGPGQPRPKLLRIVLTLEDGNDRLGVGQTYEYVFEVGR